MKFSCEKALLQNAILTASRAVSPKSTIPALEGLLLEAEDPAPSSSPAITRRPASARHPGRCHRGRFHGPLRPSLR